MDVKPWKPVYVIEADGKDITATIQKYFKSLTLTDEAGTASDSLTIVLDDEGIDLPPSGAELKLWLGYEGATRYMGVFVVDEIVLGGPPDQMTIKALAAPFKKSTSYAALQDQKTRSWEPCTVETLVKTIAVEHGLTLAVSPELAAVELDHIDQTNESDMNLLTRLARSMDAIAKAAGGRLIFVSQGENATASGAALPTVYLTRPELSRWRVPISDRGNYGSVVAVWRDKDAAEDKEVTVGDGTPVFRLRHTYASEEAATRAAQGRFKKFTRGTSKLTITLSGGRTDIMAESPLNISKVRPGVNGDWSATRVTHSLTGKLTTTAEAEIPNKPA